MNNDFNNNKQRVVIVGNGPVQRDFSSFIDSSDVVVRFNDPTHLRTSFVGTRTDVLCLACNDHVLAQSARPDGINPDVARSVSEIWFKRIERKADTLKILDVHQLHSKIIRYISIEFRDKLMAKLIDLQPAPDLLPDNACPSFGITAVETFVTSPEYSNTNLFLIGFSWEGWHGHPWSAEMKLCQQYADNHFLEFLDAS